MKRIFILVISWISIQSGFAQDTHLSSRKGEGSFGIGLGMPYGAIGIRLSTNLAEGLSIFGGLGYMLSGAGYNVGFLKDFPSSSQTQFYLTGMAGTNAAIKVQGLPEYDEVYTGATIGLGIKVNSRKTEGNFWDFGLLVPFRSSDYSNDETLVKNDPRVAEFTTPGPVLIVIGYNFNL